MKLNHRQRLLYDTLVYLLAAVAILLSIIDFSNSLSQWEGIIQNVILGIFAIDYAVRFFIAKNKKDFFLHNICDLIAIIPFSSFFRVFRFAGLLKFAKLTRIFAFLYRVSRKIRLFLNSGSFHYMAYVTGLLILIGGIAIHFTEGMSYEDGIWWAFVTASTVGYGDISPSTFPGRIIASILMLGGIGLIGTLTSTITSFFLNSGEKAKHLSYRDSTIENIKEQLDHFDTLTEGDVDSICKVLKALAAKKR